MILLGVILSLYFGKLTAFTLSIVIFSLIFMSNTHVSITGVETILNEPDFFSIFSLSIYYILPRIPKMDNLVDEWMQYSIESKEFFLELCHFSIMVGVWF